MTAETRKCRRRITTRCRKMTDIAFSSTVNASELKNTIVAEQHPADHVAMLQKAVELRDHGRGLSRDEPFEIAPQRGQQLALVDDLRERDQQQDEERNDRQQRVVGDGAREEQSLIGAKRRAGLAGRTRPGESSRARPAVRTFASIGAHGVDRRADAGQRQRPGDMPPAAARSLMPSRKRGRHGRRCVDFRTCRSAPSRCRRRRPSRGRRARRTSRSRPCSRHRACPRSLPCWRRPA